jgi:mitogen-activated protein kinase kinase kinase 13
VPFESISELQWLGSGAQGAVFVGKLENKVVAVKKVKEEKDVNIHHLRKLNHPNIVHVCPSFKTFKTILYICM